MFKLIESNGKEMKEVLSNGKTIWRLEQNTDSNDTVELLDYEEYDVEIDLKSSLATFYINNVPKTFGDKHNRTYVGSSDFKKIFSHIEILGVKFSISYADSIYYTSSSDRIPVRYSSIQKSLKQSGWTIFNNKIKLYYRDPESIKRIGRRLSVIRSDNQIAILGASDIDFRYFEIGNTGVLKNKTAISTTKAIVVTDTSKAKSIIDEFNMEDLVEEKLDVIFYLN
jgi:hypothetical protein